MALNNTIIKEVLNEESYKDLFDNAHDLIQILDLDGNLIYANKSWTEILEYSLQEIQGKSIYILVDENDRQKFIDYRNSIINGSPIDKEIIIRFNTKNGKKVSLEGRSSLRKKNAIPYYTRGIFRDITLKLQNELQLKEREYNLHQLLLHAPDAVIVINQESIVLLWNPQAEKLFGWTSEEVINQPLYDKILPLQYREAHEQGMKRYLATGEANVLNKTIEITAIDKGNVEFFISLTISTTIQNGKVAFIAFIRDIRKQKKNEAELEKKRKELELSNQQLEQFAHVTSHDMKEPIRKIRIFGQRLEQELGGEITEKAKSYLGTVQNSAERLTNMVEGVLNYATISSNKEDFEIVNLNAIVKNIENDLEVVIEEKCAILKHNNLPVFKAVNFLIYQLFYNLISNSLKFSNEKIQPVIEITSQQVNYPELQVQSEVNSTTSFFEVKIKDNGIGFDPQYAGKIFKTFTRLNSRLDFEGTGIGLSICKNIIDRHKGFIKAEGKEGEGATFTMLFPNNAV